MWGGSPGTLLWLSSGGGHECLVEAAGEGAFDDADRFFFGFAGGGGSVGVGVGFGVGAVGVERRWVETVESSAQRRVEGDECRRQLVERLQARVLGAPAFGEQEPQLLAFGAGARQRQWFAGQEPPGGGFGVDQVILVPAAASLGPLAFVDGEAVAEQCPRERGAVGAGALDHERRPPERAG